MDINSYHADTRFASKSGLDLVARSPWQYYREKMAPEHLRPRPSGKLRKDSEEWYTLLGRVVHVLCLEGNQFGRYFYLAEKLDLRTNAGKARLAELREKHPGKDMVPEEMFRLAEDMKKALFDHPFTGPFLRRLDLVETTFYWTDPDTGQPCKCRPDGLVTPFFDGVDAWGGDVIDIKTMRHCGEDSWRNSVEKWRYYVQHPFYMDGLNNQPAPDWWPAGRPMYDRFFFFCVEDSDPVTVESVAVYCLDAESVAIGRREYKRNLETWGACRESGVWPSYPVEPVTAGLPAWRLSREKYDGGGW